MNKVIPEHYCSFTFMVVLFGLCLLSELLPSPTWSFSCRTCCFAWIQVAACYHHMYLCTGITMSVCHSVLSVFLCVQALSTAWNHRAVIWFPFPISSLFLFLFEPNAAALSCGCCANGPLSCLFSQKIPQYLLFRDNRFVWLLLSS